MTLVLLDNQDSFVWNLAQAFMAVGQDVEVLRSDRVTLDEIAAREPDGIVLSPGPGRPEDAGVCVEAVRRFCGQVPLLGVCLGHQAIGVAFGASVRRAPPCHGKPWTIEHRRHHLFADLPSPFEAGRYHSLVIDRATLPDELLVEAWTPEGEIMGVRHREHPAFGVQFHPESFLTDCGNAFLARFVEGLS